MTTVEIELDSAREVMFEELAEDIPEQQLREDLQSALQQRLTALYDNQERLQINQE
jgi:hypothetical protein